MLIGQSLLRKKTSYLIQEPFIIGQPLSQLSLKRKAD